MRFFPTALAALALAACTALPHPQILPELPQQAQWFKLEQTDAAGQTVQTSLLAVERLPDGIRFVHTDALGAPFRAKPSARAVGKTTASSCPTPNRAACLPRSCR